MRREGSRVDDLRVVNYEVRTWEVLSLAGRNLPFGTGLKEVKI